MIGKPKEHLTASITKYTDQISNEEGTKLTERNIAEPNNIEGTNDLYSTFADMTIEFESVDKLFRFIFKYMPANVEVLSPSSLELSSQELSTLSNFLTTRLHDYDAVAKKLITDKDFLISKLKEFAPNLFKAQEAKPLEQEKVEEKKSTKKKSKPKKKK